MHFRLFKDIDLSLAFIVVVDEVQIIIILLFGDKLNFAVFYIDSKKFSILFNPAGH